MLQTVDVGTRTLDAYRGIAPDELLDELEHTAAILRGARIAHVNATPYGGGVSELLRSVVPLLNTLGMVVDWKVISGDDAFFQVTKKIHNGLQGAPGELTAAECDIYVENARKNAEMFRERYDFVFIHDPQPAALLSLCGEASARWVWRCHIDTSEPNPSIWQFLRQYLQGYAAAVFTQRAFLPPDLPIDEVEIIPPAIDPLSPKNLQLPETVARQVLGWIGIDLRRPLISQISRFDPWKDPLGVIQAFRLAREEVPDVQLVLAGSMALDDPQGWEIYREIAVQASEDPLIQVFTNLTGVGNIEVNAFQSLSNIVVQKSIREGFGLVVSEAMWKGTPVIAGRAGGIPLQMADGVGGILVDSVDGCARAMVELLREPERARMLGEKGKERVRERFLLPRLLLNELSLLARLAEGQPLTPSPGDEAIPRDPVCGMAVKTAAVSQVYAGQTYVFCSEECSSRFRINPTHYLKRVQQE